MERERGRERGACVFFNVQFSTTRHSLMHSFISSQVSGSLWAKRPLCDARLQKLYLEPRIWFWNWFFPLKDETLSPESTYSVLNSRSIENGQFYTISVSPQFFNWFSFLVSFAIIFFYFCVSNQYERTPAQAKSYLVVTGKERLAAGALTDP